MLRISVLLFLLCLSPFSTLVYASATGDSIMPFKAEYKVYYGDLKLGTGEYQLKQVSLDQYIFSFKSRMRFLIFSDKRAVESTFNYKDSVMVPLRYRHDRKGSGPDYYDEIDFQSKAGTITSVHKNKSVDIAYDRSIRDGLGVQLQLILDLQHGNKHPKYLILENNKVRERAFEYIGEEVLTINQNTYNCVLYQVVRDNNKRRTQMWFSPEHNYQPVKLAHFDKDKKKFNAELVSYIEMPAEAIIGQKVSPENAADVENKKALGRL